MLAKTKSTGTTPMNQPSVAAHGTVVIGFVTAPTMPARSMTDMRKGPTNLCVCSTVRGHIL